MSVDPSAGPRYAYVPDGVPEPASISDPGFSMPPPVEGEEEASPLHLSPEAEKWIDHHVLDAGYLIDWGTREIFDPNTGEVKGTVPTTFPRMI